MELGLLHGVVWQYEQRPRIALQPRCGLGEGRLALGRRRDGDGKKGGGDEDGSHDQEPHTPTRESGWTTPPSAWCCRECGTRRASQARVAADSRPRPPPP